MKINEYWRTKDTQTPTTDHETSDLPLTWDDNGTTKHYAVINTQNDDKWELKNDGWYYYKTTISQNESTDSLLKSVTFNCEVNTVGEIRYTAGGTVGEDVPSDYAEANYHLYITFQMSDEDMTPTRDTLYDIVANQTIGLDTDIDFGVNAIRTNNNGAGVNTLSAHANDDFPVYYYRGQVDNNFVVFDNICWRIMRTAEGGSVKIMYAGEYANGACPDSKTTGIGIGQGTSNASSSSDLSSIGYMHSAKTYNTHGAMTPASSSAYIAKTVSWDGQNYTLDNPVRLEGSYSNPDMRIQEYRYTCHSSDSITCNTVDYMIDFMGQNTVYSIDLTGGETLESMIASLDDNSVDSGIKTKVDEWYAQNITENRDKIADVVYCNDRKIDYGGLSQGGTGEMKLRNFFAGWTRVSGYGNKLVTGTSNNGWTPNPSIDCERKADRFTVNNNYGNKALTYPVALPTADEYVLAGGGYEESYYGLDTEDHTNHRVRFDNLGYYDAPWTYNKNTNTWTMTPLHTDTGSYHMAAASPTGLYRTTSYAWNKPDLRPVIALIHNTYVAQGDGTLADPYILEW
jgi:hypothetical protein